MKNSFIFISLAFLLINIFSCKGSSQSFSSAISSITVIDYRTIDITFDSDILDTETAQFETTSNYILASSKFTGFANVGYQVTGAAIDPEGTGNKKTIRITLNKCLLPTTYSITFDTIALEFSWNGKVVFVTKSAGSSDLKTWTKAGGNTGLGAADAICQSEANEAGLEGTFKAWLSDTNNNAKDRIGENSGGWIRTDGHVFAISMEALTYEAADYSSFDGDQGPLVPLRYHADATRSDDNMPFTATMVNGLKEDNHTHHNTEDCTQWNSQNSTHGRNPLGGATEATYYHWTDNSNFGISCDDTRPLFCFQTGNDAPEIKPEHYTEEGKIVFLTSDNGTGDLQSAGWDDYTYSGSGIDRGDNICQTLAENAGLANHTKFKAWLSTKTPSVINAIARFSYSGKWVLLNGVKIVDSKSDLVDGDIHTSIDINESGDRIYDRRDHSYVWTGTDENGNAVLSGTYLDDSPLSNLDCLNWSSVEITDFARIGRNTYANSRWTSHLSEGHDWIPCGGVAPRIYCFEDE